MGTLQAGDTSNPADQTDLRNEATGTITGGVGLAATDDVHNDGVVNTTGSVTAGDDIRNNGRFTAGGDVTAQEEIRNGDAGNDQRGVFTINGPATVLGQNFINDQGDLTVNVGGSLRASEDVTNNANGFVNNAGTIAPTRDLINSGEITANSGAIGAGRDVSNTGRVVSNSGTIGAGRDFMNQGTVETNSGTMIAIQDLVNNGTIERSTGIISAGRNVEQNGFLYSDGGLVGAISDVNVRGLLIANGGQINGDNQVVVHANGRLAGTPTVTTPLLDNQVDGTLAPGNVSRDLAEHPGIGVMTVNGNVQTNGTVEYDITHRAVPQDSDALVVNGQAVVNNLTTYANRGLFSFNAESSAPTSDTHSYEVARRYTIIDTDAPGNLQVVQRPQVEDNIELRRIVLRSDTDMSMLYTPNAEDYYAYVGRDVEFESIGITPNQKSFGRYFDSVKLLDDGGPVTNDLQWIRDTLDLIVSEDDVRLAMDQLSGEIYGTIGAMERQRMFRTYSIIAARLRDEVRTDDCCGEWDGWFTAYGTGGNVTDGENAHGYNYGSTGGQLVVSRVLNQNVDAVFL